jgi:hypothetical protein
VATACVGSLVIAKCTGGQGTVELDCPWSDGPNATCASPMGTPTCVDPTAPACGPARCSGSTLVTCDATGRVFQTDCGVLEATCAGDHCAPNASDCSDGASQCQGATLEVCVNAKWRSVGCTSIGYTGCGTASDGKTAVCQ